MFRVFLYRDTANLGDAIQTVALCRLLGNRCHGVFRDDPIPPGPPLVANGWLGYRPPPPETPAFFAGVHLGLHHHLFAAWMRWNQQPVGARDSFTTGLLRGSVPVETVGCATLTFDRYTGPRHGIYTVDSPPLAHAIPLTQHIPALSWPGQWDLALAQLDLIRRAELVYTSRLHIALPCLAFGTPVHFPLAPVTTIHDRERLILLSDIGFVFDQPYTADISAHAARFRRHLESIAGPLQPVDAPRLPQPLA